MATRNSLTTIHTTLIWMILFRFEEPFQSGKESTHYWNELITIQK